jgi:hypothetical protein
MYQLSFEKLGIYKVSVFDLLFENMFTADNLLILKPEVHFQKSDSTRADTSHITAEKIIDLLNTNSTTFSSLKMKINEVEIRFGVIHLQLDTVSEYVPDLLDFTLLLENFETQIAPDKPTENRILYSDNVILRIKNINKKLNSGYDLHIDSVSYSSKSERFTSNGLLLLPLWEDNIKNKTRLSIKQLNVDGFSVSEIRSLEKLHLSAIEISDATIVHYVNEKTGSPSTNEANSNQSKSLPQLLKDVLLDSLTVNRLTFFNVQGGNDTTIATENIRLFIQEIAFDSTLYQNPMKYLKMGNVLLSTDMFKILEKGIHVKYDDLTYSSYTKLLDIHTVQLVSDSMIFPGPQFKADLSTLQIANFSVHDFLQKKKQVLALGLDRPIVTINLYQAKSENPKPSIKKKNELLDLLDFQNFTINNGRVGITNGERYTIDLKGINLLTTGLSIISKDSIKQLKYDTLRIEIDSTEAELAKRSTNISTASVLFDNQSFEVSALQGKYNNTSGKKNISGAIDLRKFKISEIDLNNLLFNKQFNASSIVLNEPVISGNFPLTNASGADKDTVKQPPVRLPISFRLGEFLLQKGRVNIVLENPSDTIHVQTNIELQLGTITSTDSSFLDWLSPSDWQAQFNSLVVASNAYDLNAEKVSLNPRQSVFALNALTLQSKSHPRHITNKFEIERVVLPRIVVSGLDYTLLLENDSIRFGKLLINQPHLRLKLFNQETEKTDTHTPVRFNTETLLSMVYDTIDLNGLRLNIEKSSDSSHEIVKVGNFSIEHFTDTTNDNNLMPEIAFQLDEFSIEDSIKKTFIQLHDLDFDPKRMTLAIHDINWSRTNPYQRKNLAVHSSEIVFSGSYIKESLPSKVKFDKLKFSDMAISITDDKKAESQQKKEIEFDIQAFKKYSGLLSRFAIDTTVFDNVSVHYSTYDSTQQHTIRIDSIGLVVNRIDVDTSMFDQKNPILLNNIIIDLKGRTRISKDSLYEIQTGRIHYNFPEHRITVDSFYVLPRYSETESFYKAKYQKGIINLFAEKAEFYDLRIDELVKDKLLHFGGVDISGLRFNIVKDKKYPIEPGTYKPMPQDLIRSIDQKIVIDSLRVLNSYLYFKLFPEKKSTIPGQIFLDDLNLKAYHFTNTSRAEDSTTLEIQLNANIMGESRMDANFYFPLQDTGNRWWFSFKTKEIDFTKLNSMTQQLVGLTILSGKGSVNASRISGNNFNTTGTMIFRYRKIKLSLYNRKKAETETNIFNSMANFLINDLVIKSNNPKFARRPKVGVVYAERDTQKTIINYAFNSILSGMLSTLGINKKEQRKERREFKKEEKQNSWKSF